MISRLVWILLLIPAAIVLIALSVANRNVVPLTFDPFASQSPYLTVSAPLFVFLFCSLIVGLVIGSLTTWFAQGKYRKRAKQAQSAAEQLKVEMHKRDEQLRHNTSVIPAP